MKIYFTILILMMIAREGYTQYPNRHVREANKSYRKGKYDKALTEYQRSIRLNALDPVTNYNLGNAFFRSSRYEESAKSFENAAEVKQNTALRQKAFYNKGVSLSKQQKLEESIIEYKKAVILNPADEDARINLQKALLELKKRQPPQQENKDNEKKKQQNKKNQQKQPPKSNLTKKQVEQLLKALQQREQQVQQKMQQNRNRTAGKQEKDW